MAQGAGQGNVGGGSRVTNRGLGSRPNRTVKNSDSWRKSPFRASVWPCSPGAGASPVCYRSSMKTSVPVPSL